MAESKAVRISREYREQLVRNEDAALKRMSSYWAKMERETRDNMLLLAQEVTELKKAGQPVPVQYIYTMQRHMKMMEQLVELVPHYEYKALEEIERTQRLNYTLGLESANAIIQASDPSDDMWTRIRQDAAEAMAGYAGNGAPLAELLQTDYGAMASRITDALVSGIGLGKGYKQVAQDMMDAAAIDFRRSVLIARTETNRAYRQANADQYRKSGVVEKVLRLCAMSNSCAACIIMDGWECKNGICEDHPNGKCTTVVVTTGGIMPEWEHGADWLERQDEATQRSILGEGRYDLWKNYNIPLDQLVTMKENPVWGGSPSMVSIADLKAKYNIIDVKKTLIDMQPKPEPEPEPKSVIPEFIPAKTRQEAEEFAKRFTKNIDYKGISLENANKINETLLQLTSKYPINQLELLGSGKKGNAAAFASYRSLQVNGKKLGDVLTKEQAIFESNQKEAREMIETIKSRYPNKIPFSMQAQIDRLEKQLKFSRWGVHSSYEDHVSDTIIHEFGHVLSDQYFGMLNHEIANPNYSRNWSLRGMSQKWQIAFQKALDTGDIYKLSEYGSKNFREFFAESFLAREKGETLPDYVEELFQEVFNNGIM